MVRENLARLRREHNLTQAETAKAIHLTLRQYSRLECGSSDGSIKTWQALKELLGAASIDDLLAQTADSSQR